MNLRVRVGAIFGRSSGSLRAGHGTNGRQAARKCMERLPDYLVSGLCSTEPVTAFRCAIKTAGHIVKLEGEVMW